MYKVVRVYLTLAGKVRGLNITDCNSNHFCLLAEIMSSVLGLAEEDFLLHLGFCSGNASRQRYATEEVCRIQTSCFQ